MHDFKLNIVIFDITSYMTSRKAPYKDEEFLKSVGKRLRELLTDKGITHEVFYHDTDINPHRYIVGKHNMTLSNFKKICDYLEITPEAFLQGSENKLENGKDI